MLNIRPGMGEFSVIEDLSSGELNVRVRSLANTTGDGLALLARQLEMCGRGAQRIIITIEREPRPGTNEEHNLGAIGQVCVKFTDLPLTLLNEASGKSQEVRIRFGL